MTRQGRTSVRARRFELAHLDSLKASIEVNSICKLLASLNPELPYAVLGSGLAKSVETYCSTVKAMLFTLPVMGSIIAYFILRMLALDIPFYVLAAASVAAGTAVMMPLGLAIAVAMPTAMYRSRGSVLEAKFLPFAMTLALLLSGGLSVADALKTLRERFARELPEFRIELDYIGSNLELGRPVDQVLTEAALLTPSPSLRALLLSLARAARMGLYAPMLAEQSIRNYLSTYAVLVEKASTSLGFLFEIYITLGLVVPILIGITALLMAIYPALGISVHALLALSLFVLVPVVSAFTLIAAESVMSKLRI